MVGILSSMSAILLPVSIGKFYALMFEVESKRSLVLDIFPQYFFDTVPHFLLFFSTLILFHSVFSYAKRYWLAAVGELFTYDLRNQLFSHQLNLQTKIYEEKGVGKYLLRYSGDLKSIQNYLTKGIIGFGIDILMILLFLGVLWSISQSLVLISIAAILLMAFSLSILNQKLQKVSEQRRNLKSGLLSFVSQRLQAIATIKAFNRESVEYNRFLKRSNKTFLSGLAFHRLSSLNFVLVPALLYAMLALLMLVIYWQRTKGVQLNQAALLSAFLLLITMLPVIRRCLRIMVTWNLGLISFHKLQKVMDLPIEDPRPKDELVLAEGDLQLESVSLGSQDGQVLSKLNANWTHHGLHLVIGGTGSGKSLLVKMLLGIHCEYEGNILLDEQDIRFGSRKSLRKLITIVSMDYPLLGKTVFEAISYSRKERKRNGARLMLNKIQQDLPEKAKLKLDDKIGSQGSKLSKGQLCILLFTRALLTRKPILLLDEPFSSVDPSMKEHLLHLIKKLRKKRTIILFLKHNDLPKLAFDSITDLDRGKFGRKETKVRKLGG